MFIENQQDYINLKNGTKYSFNCTQCGALMSLVKYNYRKDSQIKLLCRRCLLKDTNLKLHGFEFVNPNTIEQAKLKRKETCLSKYGKEYFTQTDIYKEKTQQTCQLKYNSNSPLECTEIYQKTKETLKEHYGVSVPLKSSVILEKLKQTNIQLYGFPNVFQNEYIKEKALKTCLEKYGSAGITSCSYRYKNIHFDSSWEVAFYIYCVDHNIQIKRTPKYFNYKYQNKIHRYYPDFELPCGLIEIKGDHFFSNNMLINPYDNSVEAQLKAQAKYQCMLDNNVIILKSVAVEFAIRYVKNTYGENFLEQLKI